MIVATVIAYIVVGTGICIFAHKRTTKRKLNIKVVLGYAILVTMSYVLFSTIAQIAGIDI